ncbi:MAG TPA: GNAT family N-acetyltransferase [Ilumatobacter sp.]|nr:GNAT family N-acetyltransferase [Ilumatobacter sp.]
MAHDAIEVEPVTVERLSDLADLFTTNGTTRGCWCMYHILSNRQFGDGYGPGNRAAFERLATESELPMGVLAYHDGTPVGWCAVGPRARYQRAVGPRARILADRDPAEDDDVWLVSCFFTRVGFRGRGLTHRLLDAAAALARVYGARAVEGFPRAAGRSGSPDDYLGSEELFAAHDFACVARPSPQRVVVRKSLGARRPDVAK